MKLAHVFTVFLVCSGLFFAFSEKVEAYTYSRVPAGSTVTSQSMTIDFAISQAEAESLGWVNKSFICGGVYAPAQNSNPQIETYECKNFVFDQVITFTVPLSVADYNQVYVCDDTDGTYGDCGFDFFVDLEYDNGNTIFSVVSNGGGGSLFPNGGLLGTSASGAVMVGRVISGVTTTGSALWPFLTFAGVSLAFVIGLSLVSFMNQSTGKNSRVTTVNGSRALRGKNYRSYGEKEIDNAKRDGLL